ncbi:MAG: HAMP domain-containing sensor histidine kinase [Eubacteriales bacterium]|nr:HAMP domain-containing sensor histidine kinase [Eubacteriales bacterium]
MDLIQLIKSEYPKAYTHQSVLSASNLLIDNNYLVIHDESDKYMGILTPIDILIHPHKIIEDCVTDKPSISLHESWYSITDKFYFSKSYALPVFKSGDFLGIIEKNDFNKKLKSNIDSLHKSNQESTNIKAIFLKNISHEFRTPLNIMVGFMDLLSEIDFENFYELKDSIIPKIKYSSKKFLDVLNDLITLSSLESGESVNLEITEFSAESICIEIQDYINVISLYDQNKCIYKMQDQYPDVIFFQDRNKILQIVTKILEFASRKSTNKEVNLGCNLQNASINLFVTFNSDNNFNKEYSDLANYEDELFAGTNILLAKALTGYINGNMEIITNDNNTEILFTFPVSLNQKSKKATPFGGGLQHKT